MLWAGTCGKDDVMRTLRRVVLVLAVALVGAGAGSALFASPALAGSVEPGPFGYGVLSASIVNAIPYTWTLVAAYAPLAPPTAHGTGEWTAGPASTIPPGGSTVYQLNSWMTVNEGPECFGPDEYAFDAYITYRVDVLGGPPEYANVLINGDWNNNLCLNGGKLQNVPIWVYLTSAPPPSGYDPWAAGSAAPAAQISSPQLAYAHDVPKLYDQFFAVTGKWVVDASTASGQSLADALNTLCSGATGTSCSFTQVGPLTWGIGTAVKQLSAVNCTVGSVAPRRSSAGVVGDPPPNYTEMSFTEAQSASLSVGGGVTLSTEFNVFDTISGKISVSVQAQHEWQKTNTYTRQIYVYIPSNDIASVWIAPTVGTVKGTLVISDGSATYTITNFTEVRSGVTRDALTPAFNAVTKIRPMMPSEYNQFCQGGSTSSGLGATNGGRPTVVRAPARLVAGRGVAHVSLGQTRAAVMRVLGQPSRTLFSDQKCRGLDPRCDAVRAIGGIGIYRQMSVLFGNDSRVSGLIYRGPVLSARGVGVGSVVTAVRSAYPGAVCTGYARQRYCTVRGVLSGRAVKTVFRFTTLPGGRSVCDRVLIYLVDPRSGQVGA